MTKIENTIIKYQIDFEKYKKDLQSFFDYVELYENGTACEQIYDYMKKH